MANLKPWYTLVAPREDLREGKPLDAAEFAVHLDQIRDGKAPDDYKNPAQFFDRTYLTQNLTGFAAEVLRRLSGEKTETSAVFNMETQFGGGKTHALAMLYHLAKNGPKAEQWRGVKRILEKGHVSAVPEAATAVFVGTEFDSLTGRGGNDGTPLRKTPWGEIAFQLGGKQALSVVEEHEKQFSEPKGDVIRAFLPKDRPCLILMDEVINYVSTYRKFGYHNSLYNFVHALSEVARGSDNVVLVVSIPSSISLNYTAEDESDQQRYSHMLNRLGKAVVMSAERETAEIIRRRLFEWGGLPDEAKKTVAQYADWVIEHRHQLPTWFPIDNAREAFADTYPFHPMVFSLFERKWQNLPRFQRTRGVLRLLALWVSRAYQDGYRGAHRDPLIGLGTAPLEDTYLRSALFEQLGEQRLEGAVTTDIAGRSDAHAVRLDQEAVDTIKKARLHRKVATTIFFESNGGQTRMEATVPEIRLSVAEPDLDIGNVETALETLTVSCYYLSVEGTRYRFSLQPNLNKLLADRRANISPKRIHDLVRGEIQKVFGTGKGVERVFFPEKSSQIPDRTSLTFVIVGPDQVLESERKTMQFVQSMIREYGSSNRTFKSALIWCVPEGADGLRDEARKVLAWEDIQDEAGTMNLDEGQRRQLNENVKKAQRDLRETVWRTYKNVMLLGKDNAIRKIDMGLIHSSAGDSLISLILNRLRQEGDVEESISPTFLVRNWPPAFTEWSTKALRDAFYASPQFPRLLHAGAVKDAIVRGVSNGFLAYVGKTGSGTYDPFIYKETLLPDDVEISDETFVITAEEAEKHIEPPALTRLLLSPAQIQIKPGEKQAFVAKGLDQHGREIAVGTVAWKATGGTVDAAGVFVAEKEAGHFEVVASVEDISGSAKVMVTKDATPPPPPPPEPKSGEPTRMIWSGKVTAQKWMNFYTKVLAKFARNQDLNIYIQFEAISKDGFSEQDVADTKNALRELGLDDGVQKS